MAYTVKPLSVMPATHIGDGSCSGCSAAYPDPPYTSGKATEYSPYVWASATMWTTQIKILAMGFNLAQNWPLYRHLERESVDLRISPSNYIVVHLKNDKLIHIYVTYSALIITWEKRLGNSFYFYLSTST